MPRMGANIFHRPQTFSARREHLFTGRKHFSSSAKDGREHFSQAANIFSKARTFVHRPQTFSAGHEQFSKAANISLQVPRGAQTFYFFFHRPQTVGARFSRFACLQSRVCKEQKQSPKRQSKSKKVILCHPQALKMPLCKECKKLTISSSPPSSSFHTFDSPFPPCKFSPHSSFPMGGHDNAKRAQKKCNCFAKP
jgi:hypothetical protein